MRILQGNSNSCFPYTCGDIKVQYEVVYEDAQSAADAEQTIKNASSDLNAQLNQDLVSNLNEETTGSNRPAVSSAATGVTFEEAYVEARTADSGAGGATSCGGGRSGGGDSSGTSPLMIFV